MTGNNRKAFVLGLDGASWNLLKQLMKKGFMPSLQNICNKGVTGNLISTTPPFTGPAWVSIVTGVNPGKHGVFGFTRKKGDTGETVFCDSRDVKTPKVWNYLNSERKTAGLVNIPMTFPAETINGFIIPGFLTPRNRTDYTYPVSLYNELKAKIGDYVIDIDRMKKHKRTKEALRQFFDETYYIAQKRFEAMKYLWGEYSNDFFMIVFTCLDRIQHVFWKYLDENCEEHYSEDGKRACDYVFKIYELVDDIIAYLIRNIDENTLLYIVSDHGFGPFIKKVEINKWLEREGLLTVRKGQYCFQKGLLKLKIRQPKFMLRHIKLGYPLIDRYIDYDKTFFYGGALYEQGIYYNTMRESSGIRNGQYELHRERLKESLLKLKDPENNMSIVDEIKFREEVYWGPYVAQAPDLLLKIMDYSYLANKAFSLRKHDYISRVKMPDGCHRQKGVFAAYGRGIVRKQDFCASVTDIAPTIMYGMGFAKPENMDGIILDKIFTPEFLSKNKISFPSLKLKDTISDSGVNSDYNSDEEYEITKKLKDLGYLD